MTTRCVHSKLRYAPQVHKKLSRRQWGLAILIVALATINGANWQSLLMATAVATSDKRPNLLSDAEWGKRSKRYAG